MTVTPQTNTTLKEIASEIKARDNFVICGHVNPDGDCIGSQLALEHALKALGKTVTGVLAKPDSIDTDLMFLPGTDGLVPALQFSGELSTFIAVDVPTRSRMGEDACALLDKAQFSITIDHHAVDQRMTDIDYTDPDSASTTMLIWELCNLLMDEPPHETALCCYTGLVTDTGCFQFQNTDKNAFESASSMVAAGVVPAEVTRHVMQNRSRAALALTSIAVDRMMISKNGHAIVSYITKADMESVGAKKEDGDSIVNTLRSVRGVSAVAMLREQDDHVRASLRAKDDTNVAVVAQKFNGGGHIAAAGCTLEMPIEEAAQMILEALDEALA